MTNTLVEFDRHVPSPTTTTVGSRLDQFRRDSTYLLTSLPIAVFSFTTVVTATAVSVALLPIAIGLPLLAVSLMIAGGLASVERLRLRALGMHVPTPARAVGREGWRGWVDAIRNTRSWLDAMHAVVTFPSAVVTWSLALTWWAGALGGLSYPLWQWTLPDGSDDNNLADLMGISSEAGDIALGVGIGLAFAVTILPVVRGLAGLQSGLSRSVLAPEQVGTPGAQ